MGGLPTEGSAELIPTTFFGEQKKQNITEGLSI
jgi:hypothetical protein